MSDVVKIVIDADVIIHFIKGESLFILPQIYPRYSFVILDKLLDQELRISKTTRIYLDNFIQHFRDRITIVQWKPDYAMIKELSILREKYGYGESLSLVYCKFHHDVIASSNIKDIKDYCEKNDIQYITTMDLIWKAFTSKLMSEEECNTFLRLVIEKGSKLPCTRITDFTPRKLFL